MKKSLVIISFAFIFLLSMSIVSAGFFDWITGNAGLSCGVCPSGTLCDRSVGVCFPASTTSTSGGLSCPNCPTGQVCDTAKGVCRSESTTSTSAGLSCGVCPSGTLCDRSVGVCFPASTTSTSDGRTKTTRTSTTSSDNLRTSQSSDVTKAPRGWTEVDDAYGGKCYVKEAKSIIKQTRTGGVIRWWGNGQVVINDNGDIVLTQN